MLHSEYFNTSRKLTSDVNDMLLFSIIPSARLKVGFMKHVTIGGCKK